MSANDGVDFSSPNSSFNQQEQPVTLFASSCTTSDVPTDDQSATSSTLEASNKIKNKKRQPKYRATKRPPSERRFQCDHCESRFFTQKDVKRHLVVHTGIRNFACPYCTQRFGRKDHLVRHAKKTHDQDTRSFKRRNRAQSLNASTSNPTESKKTRKSTARSKKKPEENFAAVQPNTCTTASTATVTTTSTSTSYYLHDNGFSSANRVAATSNPNFNNSALMLSSTSIPFPKMTLVDHPSTSTLTASFTHSRNYPSSFNNFEHASPNFQYNANGTFNQFLPETSGTPYSAQLSSNSTYLNYDYKQPSSNVNYTSNSQHDNFVNSSTDHLANVTSNSNNISAFKSITSSIVDGFNTCIDLEYNNAGMNNFNAPISNAPFSESSHTSRFHTPFN